MASRPANVTDCTACGKEVGVQREFKMNLDKTRPYPDRWRISVHGKPRCVNSRIVVADSQVRRKRYNVAA